MPLSLDQEAMMYLKGMGAPITTQSLNEAMNMMAAIPQQQRPSYQSLGAGIPQEASANVLAMGGGGQGWGIGDGAPPPGAIGTVNRNQGLDPRDPRLGHPGVDTSGMTDAQIGAVPYDQLATNALPQNVLRPNRPQPAPPQPSGIMARPGPPLPAQASDTSYLNRPGAVRRGQSSKQPGTKTIITGADGSTTTKVQPQAPAATPTPKAAMVQTITGTPAAASETPDGRFTDPYDPYYNHPATTYTEDDIGNGMPAGIVPIVPGTPQTYSPGGGETANLPGAPAQAGTPNSFSPTAPSGYQFAGKGVIPDRNKGATPPPPSTGASPVSGGGDPGSGAPNSGSTPQDDNSTGWWFKNVFLPGLAAGAGAGVGRSFSRGRARNGTVIPPTKAGPGRKPSGPSGPSGQYFREGGYAPDEDGIVIPPGKDVTTGPRAKAIPRTVEGSVEKPPFIDPNNPNYDRYKSYGTPAERAVGGLDRPALSPTPQLPGPRAALPAPKPRGPIAGRDETSPVGSRIRMPDQSASKKPAPENKKPRGQRKTQNKNKDAGKGVVPKRRRKAS